MTAGGPGVLWLYGPPGVGKSTTAWQLYAHVLDGEPRAHVDVDQVGICYPEPEDDPGRFRLKNRTAGALVRRFVDAGARTVVVSGVLQEGSLHEVTAQLDGVPVAFCRLRSAPEVLRRRLERRYGPEDVAGALAAARTFDDRDPGPVVDTDDGTPLQVARRVLEAVGGTGGPPAATTGRSSPAPMPTPVLPAAGPGHAVLVCGPAVVGTSTIGFSHLRRLLAAGTASAFVDLRQISFLTGIPPSGGSGHVLSAACAADLWAQYRAVGARELVLVGHVDQPEDVARYRVALAGTPLVVVRLRADRTALQERVLARTRGEGPALAGDALVGASPAEAGAVVEGSLSQQEHLERAGVGDLVIDTDGRGPDAVVAELSARLAARPVDAGRGR